MTSIIENTASGSEQGLIRLSHLPDWLFNEGGTQQESGAMLSANLAFSAVEKEAIIQAARVTNGRIQEMSRLLNIGRTTLWRKMKQYDIDASQFKRTHLR